MRAIVARLDRVQILSSAPHGRKPPTLKGFRVIRDSFVRCQTTTGTYARCRRYRSTANGTQIFWQYARLKGWLKPWKITIVADDETGLAYEEVNKVLEECRYYRFLTVEIAVDFDLSAGVNRQFILKHAVFGKSHRRA